jgi:hypothetical protein
MTQNVFGLAGAGERLSATQTLSKFVDLGQGSANAVWILAPFAIAAIGAGLIGRRLTPYQIALVSAVAILLPVLADVGTDFNQFIDVAVLTAVVAAEATRAAAPPAATAFVRPLALAAILWGSLSSYQANVRADTVTAVRSLLGQDTGYAAPLPRSITPGDRVLSEDPYVAISHGQDLSVLDGFMVVGLARDHPALAGRVHPADPASRVHEDRPRRAPRYRERVVPDVQPRHTDRTCDRAELPAREGARRPAAAWALLRL